MPRMRHERLRLQTRSNLRPRRCPPTLPPRRFRRRIPSADRPTGEFTLVPPCVPSSRLSGPFHKYGDVVGEGFFVQTRREHRAYPPVICEVRATPSARKRPAEYVSGFMKWTTKPETLLPVTGRVLKAPDPR